VEAPLVLESLDHAQARGAKIIAELVGYGATSDGYDMVAPSGEGAKRCMEIATASVNGAIDYINAHGTSTPVGDVKELGAIKEVFGDNIPLIGSTKSLSGHALGAAGVNESIYSLLMLQNDFVAESVNIENLDI
jgi:3-oxoacyl-[acyl-carrier-protein] synthase-1